MERGRLGRLRVAQVTDDVRNSSHRFLLKTMHEDRSQHLE